MENILIKKNALTKSQFTEVLNIIENNKEKFQEQFDNNNFVNFKRWFPESGHKIANITDLVIFNENIKKMVDKFRDLSWRSYLADVNHKFEVQITKYKPKDQYDWHDDHRTKDKRILNWIIYLNDDFEGGELLLSDVLIRDSIVEYKKYKISQTIKPKKNMLVMMPSWTLHKVNPVISGNPRLTLNGHIS